MENLVEDLSVITFVNKLFEFYGTRVMLFQKNYTEYKGWFYGKTNGNTQDINHWFTGFIYYIWLVQVWLWLIVH